MTHVQETPAGSLSELLDHGRDMLQAGKSDQAIEIFQRATQEHPRNSKAWNDLGVALHATQKPNLAIEAFKMAILMDPGHVDAALNLAIFHYNRGRAIDGLAVLREAYRRNPNSAELRDEMLDQGLIRWRPLALVWKGGDHEVAEYAERTLKRVGFMVNSPERTTVAACSPVQDIKPASWVRYFRQVQPMLFLVPPGARVDQMALDAARKEGVPIHMMADYLPEKGWDADLTKVEQALEVILQEVPKAPNRDNGPDPLITVVVTATRNDADCSGVLDRLAMQDLEPGLFEVLVVDDGVRPPLAKSIEPSHFPYFCKLYRSESAGLFAARDRAMEDARGKWIFYFSQAERPGPRCLRRMLREQLAGTIKGTQFESGTAPNEHAPVGKFWQYQLRQAIREEVGQLLDKQLNTVDFGLQMQRLIESAGVVRQTVPVDKRVQFTDLVETVRGAMLDEGTCVAMGRPQSKWLSLLAEGLERKMEGFHAVFSLSEVVAEEPSTTEELEEDSFVHWTPGVLSHTWTAAMDVQETPISFLAFDQCDEDTMDFVFESAKTSLQSGSVVVIREAADGFGSSETVRPAFLAKFESLGIPVETLGVATDGSVSIYAIQVR